ncbi:MAG: hypothetical protein M0O97_02955 [Arcobacteraceae bacterium]|nr:hypothetical protein [Arcobacteraceae bacterium]
MIKNSEVLISVLLENPYFQEIKERIPVHKLLKNTLTKHIFDMVLFAKYQNNLLTIGVHHPVAQFELNNFKPILIKYAKMLDRFKDIQEVRVFRYEKLKTPPLIKENDIIKYSFFQERSYGIFENHLKDDKLYDQIEEIRDIIKKEKNNGN